ncbi:MAG: hypothetical protein QOI66_2921 [Myxococcales bacterium]|nr:hypothetical protein [Myxococcales bacterium]
MIILQQLACPSILGSLADLSGDGLVAEGDHRQRKLAGEDVIRFQESDGPLAGFVVGGAQWEKTQPRSGAEIGRTMAAIDGVGGNGRSVRST